MTEPMKDAVPLEIDKCMPKHKRSTRPSRARAVSLSVRSARDSPSKDCNDTTIMSEYTTLSSGGGAVADNSYFGDFIPPESATSSDDVRMATLPPPRRFYNRRRISTSNSSTEDAIVLQEQSGSRWCTKSEESSDHRISTSNSSIEDFILLEEIRDYQKRTNPLRLPHVRQQQQVEKAALVACMKMEKAKKVAFTKIKAEDKRKAPEKNEASKSEGAETLNAHVRRNVTEIDNSDSESNSTVSNDNNDSSDGSVSDKNEPNEAKTYGPRTEEELTIGDLPPVKDLEIGVGKSQSKCVGTVSQIVNEIDRDRPAVGEVCDMLDSIKMSIHCARTNSAEHVSKEKMAKEEMTHNPFETENSNCNAELMKNKSCDLSCMNDTEPSISCLDLSDDGDEARHTRTLRKNDELKQNSQLDNEFVKKMNQKNLELTEKRKKEDEAKEKRRSSFRRPVVKPSSRNDNTSRSLVTSQPLVPVSEGFRIKMRTYTNSEQSSHSAQYYNVTTAVATSIPYRSPKFNIHAQVDNFICGGYRGPPPPPPPVSTYAFSPQIHYSYVCAPHPVPRTPFQNYLTTYTRTPIPSPAIMRPPFPNFVSSVSSAMPSYSTQPRLPLPTLSASTTIPVMPSSFTSHASLQPAPSLSTVSPQAAYFHRAEGLHQMAPGRHANTYSSFRPRVVLPPSNIPPQQIEHQRRRGVTMVASPDRRLQQYSTTNSFFPTSYYKF